MKKTILKEFDNAQAASKYLIRYYGVITYVDSYAFHDCIVLVFLVINESEYSYE